MTSTETELLESLRAAAWQDWQRGAPHVLSLAGNFRRLAEALDHFLNLKLAVDCGMATKRELRLAARRAIADLIIYEQLGGATVVRSLTRFNAEYAVLLRYAGLPRR